LEGHPAVLKMKIHFGDSEGDDDKDHDVDDDDDDGDGDDGDYGDDDDGDDDDGDDDDAKPLEVGHQVSHCQRSELSLRFSRQLVAP